MAIEFLQHFAFAVFFSVTLYYDLNIFTPGVSLYGGRWKYLTFLDVVFQVSFFILASIGDILTFIRGKEVSWINSIRDTLYASIVFPCGIFVTASFWGIYAFDRELIYPKFLDEIIPSWINHGLHTWCAVAMILEGAIVHHHYPRNVVGLFLTALFSAGYLGWISYIAYAKGFWVYPFLNFMENSARATFFGVCAMVLIFLYLMGKWMTRFIWEGEQITKTAEENKAAKKRKAKKIE